MLLFLPLLLLFSPPSPSSLGSLCSAVPPPPHHHLPGSTGDLGDPQALGRPGWVAGGAGTELGRTSGFAHTGEGQERQSKLRVPSLAVSRKER